MYPELASSELFAFSQDVQKNCHISDAQFAGNYTLCIYLLKMREFYRWETQQAFNTTLGNDEVGNWLKQREALWSELEDSPFQLLKIDGQVLEPFESEAINRQLQAHDLI